MTMQYIPTTTLYWPTSICKSIDHQRVWRSILRKNKSSPQQLLQLKFQCRRVPKKPTLIAYAAKSSLFHKTNESEIDLSGCSAKLISGSEGRVFRQPNTVGILGGASERSTVDFLKKLVEWSSVGSEDNNLPLLLCSDPQLKKELSSSLAGVELSTFKKSDRGCKVVSALREKILFMESSGVSCIVMPCHVSLAWYDELSQGCSVPFLHIGDCVAQELKDADLRPIETGSNVKIGLLGTEATMRAGFYQEKLINQGFEVVLPDKATMEHVVVPALDALHRKDIEGARILLRIALQVLLVRAVSMVVLASYDMHSLLTPDDPLLKKCIDPIDTLARATVKWSHTARNIT